MTKDRNGTDTGRNESLADMVAAVRQRADALNARLANGQGGDDDASLRADIADIGARMVALTAASEGPQSPIHQLIANAEEQLNSDLPSLAERIRDLTPPSSHPAE